MTDFNEEFLHPDCAWIDPFESFDLDLNESQFTLDFPPLSFPDPVTEHRRTLSGPVPTLNFGPPVPCHRRTNSFPPPRLDFVVSDSDSEGEFMDMCRDTTVKFNPQELGLLPRDFWREKSVTFADLVRTFFQKKNSTNVKFSYKLFNVLALVEAKPHLSKVFGVEWVTDKVLKVDKRAFARLLGIRFIDGSLFHQQGNFPSHGFMELGIGTALDYVSQEQLKGVDFDNVRLFTHREGAFVRGSSGEVLERLKWIKTAKA
jgi:hypothetical protein